VHESVFLLETVSSYVSVNEFYSFDLHWQLIDFGTDRNHPHLGKGFAYIDFVNADEAETAMKHMDGGQIDGQVRSWLN
jgi:RNA-binding protein with serine-rich domain 1